MELSPDPFLWDILTGVIAIKDVMVSKDILRNMVLRANFWDII